jgi:sugar lactone lactonase YvrE
VTDTIGGTMHKFYLTAVSLVAVGLLGGCANPPQSSFAPVAAQTQALPQAAPPQADPMKARGGRVLYIGNIDGSPGVGQVLVYTASMKDPQLLRTINNGTGRPIGLWVDTKNNLWVANETDKYPASVTAFKPGASSPFFTITDLNGQPGSVAVDAGGNVYVNESVQDEGYVQVYAPGSSEPKATLNTGVGGYAFDPGSMAFDSQGNLYVAESAKLQLQIVKLAPGSSQFTPVNLDLKDIEGPGMGIDKAGNIYVGNAAAATVSVYPPGQTEPSRVINNVGAYGLTWVTPRGAVYQSSGESSVIEIAPGANTPTHTLGCTCQTLGAAVSN